MPHSPDSPSPLMTVTGNTLVLAPRYALDKDFGPRPRTRTRTRTRTNRCARLFAIAVLGTLVLLLCAR